MGFDQSLRGHRHEMFCAIGVVHDSLRMANGLAVVGREMAGLRQCIVA